MTGFRFLIFRGTRRNAAVRVFRRKMGAEPSESAENVLLAFVLVVARFYRLGKYRGFDIFSRPRKLLSCCFFAIGLLDRAMERNRRVNLNRLTKHRVATILAL